jgi:hypothetical protein
MKECYALNLLTNTMKRKADMFTARQHQGICSLMNHIYVAAGQVSNNEITNECERYDYLTDKWEKIPDLPDARFSPSMIGRVKFVYSFGGLGSNQGDNIEAIYSIDVLNL